MADYLHRWLHGSSEACGLRWSDVDLDAGWLTVAQTVTVTVGQG